MLWNPGELPTDWTVAKLKGKHPSRPFNPDVANAFFRAGMIETWGRGIERMLEACRAANSPRPASAPDALGSVEALVLGRSAMSRALPMGCGLPPGSRYALATGSRAGGWWRRSAWLAVVKVARLSSRRTLGHDPMGGLSSIGKVMWSPTKLIPCCSRSFLRLRGLR